jgi:hypothetical protein
MEKIPRRSRPSSSAPAGEHPPPQRRRFLPPPARHRLLPPPVRRRRPPCLHSPFSHLQRAAGEPRASVPTFSAPPAVPQTGGPPCLHSLPLAQDRRLPPPGRRCAPTVHAAGVPLLIEALLSSGSWALPEAREPTVSRYQSYLYGNFANRPSISKEIHY